MSASIEPTMNAEQAPAQHITLSFCVPLIDPTNFETGLSFHCNQYESFSEVKNPEFKLDFELFQGGKLIDKVFGEKHKGDEILQCKFTDLPKISNLPTLLIAKITCPNDQPIDPYAYHVHRQTGCVVSHPLILFMGLEAMNNWLTTILDNSLFWAGLNVQPDLYSQLIVMNPYDASMRYQVTVYGNGELKFNSEPKRIISKSFDVITIQELFPQILELPESDLIDYTLCVSSQYSTKVLYGIKHKESGYFTTLDHLHEYVFR